MILLRVNKRHLPLVQCSNIGTRAEGKKIDVVRSSSSLRSSSSYVSYGETELCSSGCSDDISNGPSARGRPNNKIPNDVKSLREVQIVVRLKGTIEHHVCNGRDYSIGKTISEEDKPSVGIRPRNGRYPTTKLHQLREETIASTVLIANSFCACGKIMHCSPDAWGV